MSITFGSVGDVIAVGQIAWSLAKALNDSRGSAKEYQGLVKELQAFERAVLQIVALWQNYDCPDVITTDAAKDWLDTLRAFQEKVNKKYGKCLGAFGSGNWAKDVSKKLIWLKEKEDILDLRRKLNSASDTITMLTLASMGKSNKLAESAMTFRVQAVHFMLEDSKKRAEEQAAQIKAIDEKIDKQSKTSDLILNNVKSSNTSLTQVHSMTIDIKNILGLFQSHISMQQSTPRGLGTGWQQDPVTLEDALGFRIPIPLELVNSWDMLDTILIKRFEKRSGHQKVLKGEYVIEEGITGRDVSRENELIMCLRPGQKIDMSMIFSDLNGNSNHCPRCFTKSEASSEARTQCTNTSCQMWFQRLVEIDESEPEPMPRPIDMLSKEPAATSSSSRTKRLQVSVLTPANFQRVRLMSTLRKTVKREKIEEAYSGATKDWAIVDVPPGTERVRIDYVGDGPMEVIWQRYNGVRRSRFSPTSDFKGSSNGREVLSHIPPRPAYTEDLWTEFTKDLVVREAIEQLGYDFEETEYFYYVMQYLRYEDVLELVQLTEIILRERQYHIREIQHERERFERRERDREEWERRERLKERVGFEDEQIIEREVIYNSGRRPRRGGW